MKFAKLSITALLAGGLMLPAPAHAQQSQNAQYRNSQSPPSEAGTANPGTAASPGGGMSYRDAIGARAGLGWNAPSGTYQAPVPNTPQYQGVQPPVAAYSPTQPGGTAPAPSSSGYAPAPSGSDSQSPLSSGAPAPSSGYSQSPSSAAPAPSGSSENVPPTDPYAQTPFNAYAPNPTNAAPYTPGAALTSYLRADFDQARQALRVRSNPDAAQWIRTAAARLDQVIAADPYQVASQSELLAARDRLNALAA